ncbi:hypothetical protein [Chryseobacterium sp. HSC-36S06]|uniref:hypothetical protein n=1 Tax=Chryseobacterium sp. HSC-36S06 TaxID=2910970 RepID=UPI002A0E676E|nr:hypothetical protein [Chryseobacterium sp. HSC-36S06]
MFGFVKGGFDFQDQIAAVALAFSGDALDVFGVNAEAGDSGFASFIFLCGTKFGNPNEYLSVGGRQYRDFSLFIR